VLNCFVLHGIRVHYGVTRKPGETFWWLVFKIASTSYIR